LNRFHVTSFAKKVTRLKLQITLIYHTSLKNRLFSLNLSQKGSKVVPPSPQDQPNAPGFAGAFLFGAD
jgi:hypothetical protein